MNVRKNGFTLIELLAVIVILAIIALIATPIILGVIDKAKKGAAEQSVNGYINAIENQVVVSQLTNGNELVDGVYDLPMDNIEVKGSKPTSGWVEIEKGIVKNYSMVVNGYVITKGEETKQGDKATDKPSGGTVIKNGPSKTEASETDTHKGIVYLDPTDLNKTCTKELAESNLNESGTPTGIKTGCMKWYIYSEDDSNYTMILDHDTTSAIVWNNDNKNVTYNESNVKPELDKLVNDSKWKATPRLITTDEIVTMTGKTDFNSSDANTWFYLHNNINTNYLGNKAKYSWLFDYTSKCTSYGCNTEDSNASAGYWTATTIGTAGSGTAVWELYENGSLGERYAQMNSGVRPVITISKTLISQ